MIPSDGGSSLKKISIDLSIDEVSERDVAWGGRPESVVLGLSPSGLISGVASVSWSMPYPVCSVYSFQGNADSPLKITNKEVFPLSLGVVARNRTIAAWESSQGWVLISPAFTPFPAYYQDFPREPGMTLCVLSGIKRATVESLCHGAIQAQFVPMSKFAQSK